MPEFNPDEPFEVASFDPSKPFDLPGFDPSKPFTPEGEIEIIPSQQGPRLPVEEGLLERAAGVAFGPVAEIVTGAVRGEITGARGKREEKFQQVQTKPPEWAAENFNRLQEALGFTPRREKDRKAIIEKAFGDRATLAFHEGLNEHVIRFDTGEIVPFDPAGIGAADIRGMRGEAQVLGAEIGAGLAGLATGAAVAGPSGAIVGGVLAAPIGAGIGRYQTLQQGKAAGFHDLTDSEILAEAAFEAAISFGGELIAGGGGAIVRRFIANPQAKRFLGELTEDQIDRAIKYADDLSSRVKARTGKDIGATIGQVTAQVAPETGRRVQTFERGLEAAGVEVGAGARASQEAAEKALKKEMLGKVPKDLEEALPFGEAVKDVAEGNLGRAREQIVKTAHEERAEAIAKQLAIADAPPTLTSAEGVRTWMKESRDSVFTQLGDNYKKFWAGVPDQTFVDLSGLRSTAAKWHGVLKRDIFKSLTEEDVKLVKSAMRAGLETKKIPALDVDLVLVSKEVTEDIGGTFDQVSRALSTLKAEQRILKETPGFARSKEGKLLNDFISELDAARDVALEGLDPALRMELDALDTAYRVAKEEIDLSLINRMITKKKSGGFRISDDALFNTVLRNPSEARNIARIISNPDYAAFNTSEGIRDGIMGVYRDRVIDGTMTHKSFMNQYGPSLKQFFNPKEMHRFDSLEKATTMIRVADANEKALLKDLSKTFAHKVTAYNPEEVIEFTVGNLSETRRLKKMLSKHPGKWEQYKALRARKFLNDVEVIDDVGERSVDFGKLDNLLKNEKGELTEVFGKEFPEDVQLLADIAKLRKVPKSVASKLTRALKEVESTPALLLWRAMFARPLSRLGLITTSTLKLDRQAARRATAKLLSNPELLREGMNLYRRNSSWDMWKRFTKNIGAIELARAAEDELNE